MSHFWQTSKSGTGNKDGVASPFNILLSDFKKSEIINHKSDISAFHQPNLGKLNLYRIEINRILITTDMEIRRL